MPRPTILVAEPEPLQALSTRKLILETAKFNVLTAHSTQEAIDLFHLFPNISMAVMVAGENIDCKRIARAIKGATSKIPVIGMAPIDDGTCDFADKFVSSYEPDTLLEVIRAMLGDPRKLDQQIEEKGKRG
jgi:hypothetical protein